MGRLQTATYEMLENRKPSSLEVKNVMQTRPSPPATFKCNQTNKCFLRGAGDSQLLYSSREMETQLVMHSFTYTYQV